MARKYTLVFFFLILLSMGLSAQKSEVTLLSESYSPDSSIPALIQGSQGKKYEDALQVLIPNEVSFNINGQFISAGIMQQELIEMTGLPLGISYSCSSPDCRFVPGSENYITIQGTPEVPGVFSISASFKTTAMAGGDLVTRYSTIDYYSISVQPELLKLVNESTGEAFAMEQNVPNPCTEITGIRFSLPSAGEVDLRIFNLIGKEVYRSLINAEAGENDLKFDVREFSPGVYMYTMIYEGQSISKRMVISRK